MKIDKIEIMGLDSSIIASGYPMRTELNGTVDEKALKRIINLTKASNGNGAHAQFLTGIRVAFDLTFSNKAWIEASRYRFFEFVSSQSTMHRIAKFDIKEQCNDYVVPQIIDVCEGLRKQYLDICDTEPVGSSPQEAEALANRKKEAYLKLLYNIPSGFELTARMTTNYRCLLNIWVQRHDHRLPEWREFCKELLKLPYFKAFVEAYTGKPADPDEEF